MSFSVPQPGEVFFQSEPSVTLTILFSCLSSYSLMLNMISTTFFCFLLFCTHYFFSLLQICNSNKVNMKSLIRCFDFILYAANDCMNVISNHREVFCKISSKLINIKLLSLKNTCEIYKF